MVKFELDSTTRRPKPPLVDFEDTQANTELPPEVQEIWRDSSIDLEHGLDSTNCRSIRCPANGRSRSADGRRGRRLPPTGSLGAAPRRRIRRWDGRRILDHVEPAREIER